MSHCSFGERLSSLSNKSSEPIRSAPMAIIKSPPGVTARTPRLMVPTFMIVAVAAAALKAADRAMKECPAT